MCLTWRFHHLCYKRLAQACGTDRQDVDLNSWRRAIKQRALTSIPWIVNMMHPRVWRALFLTSVFCQLGMAGKYGRLCQQMRKIFEKYLEKNFSFIVHRHCALVWFLRPMTITMWPHLLIHSTSNASIRRKFSELCGAYEMVYVPFF